jgi:hypothetical protein
MKRKHLKKRTKCTQKKVKEINQQENVETGEYTHDQCREKPASRVYRPAQFKVSWPCGSSKKSKEEIDMVQVQLFSFKKQAMGICCCYTNNWKL